ncbi:hypothetical protein BAC_A0098 (plasmid) [Bacillus anthracis str. A0488]|uniref:Uncharacterized protein n=1 Tax=Bacillus anthracis TaxID=1392 RepID=Q6EZM7_BACAN|nr:hypothetical protein BX_A0151 [Bacillus anthracis str. A2012]AAT28892.2 hypothetical protein GBAA_pXO1_0151 [Bacillus anthracis str. 'Ames Ancestor']ADK08176.1 hypothetical protein BACI_pCIXO101410 [Bacillus cereus biovar anthracis str. CI]EDR16315.1 hypothetical protein BAC_A0098 [Bacillus anthracis str. A0488]EDR85276.1 hypothetical protein BAQ_A0195 [Bacillus anthracis str. A0193]EDR90551.1 hypothetical protein BAH_A0104 [Bacillus anthracis str. A0442]EDS94370.1 hypothetical protein BAK
MANKSFSNVLLCNTLFNLTLFWIFIRRAAAIFESNFVEGELYEK